MAVAQSEGGLETHIFLLVSASAVLHAFWNFAARKAKGSLHVLSLGKATPSSSLELIIHTTGMLLGTFLLVPFIVAFKSDSIQLWEGFPYVIATVILHVLYMVLLSLSYGATHGSVSVVYPVARGSGVALTALVSSPILGEEVSTNGVFGITLMILGIIALSTPSQANCCRAGKYDALVEKATTAQNTDSKASRPDTDLPSSSTTVPAKSERGCESEDGDSRLALVHSAQPPSDAQAKLSLETAPNSKAPPIEGDVGDEEGGKLIVEVPKKKMSKGEREEERRFILREKLKVLGLALMVGCVISAYSVVDKLGVGYVGPIEYFALLAFGETLFFLPWCLSRPGGPDAFKTALQTQKRWIVIVGMGLTITYVAILYALQRSKATYVVALRESSVLVGSILGFTVLKEECSPIKAVGVILVVCGIAFLKLAD